MRNKEYHDLRELRRDVVSLILAGRYEFSYHAENTHPELTREEKLEAVLYGENDRPNRHSRPGHSSYVCWYDHDRLGLIRSVYAIVEPPEGGQVLIITVFQEDVGKGTLG